MTDKKKNYKRKYQKRDWWTKRHYFSLQGVAKKVYNLQKLINSEKKYSDTSIGTSVNNIGTVTLINGVNQGDTLSQRNGNSILMNTLTFRGSVVMDTTVNDTLFTLWVIQDLQQQADTVPTIAEMFDNSLGYEKGFMNRASYPGRFKILAKRTFRQQPNVNVFKADMDISLPHPGVHIKYNGTAYTDITKNGIYLVAVSTRTTNLPYLNLGCRVNFYDN